jgi:hypothetical protein
MKISMRKFYEEFYGEYVFDIKIICLLKVYEYRANQVCEFDANIKTEFYD